MNTKILAFLFLALFCVNSCQKNELEPEKAIKLDPKSAQLVESDNAFGLHLFQKIREESREENLMISPLSVSFALAMAYNGAEGKTREEMEKVLQKNGLTREQINTSYEKLMKDLQSLDEDVVFEIANAVFYATSASVKPDFTEILRRVYDAEVKELDFSNPSAVDAINGWVAEKTRDKITKIIDQLSPYDRMVLLNAIYFYGSWTYEFEEKGTQMRSFYKSGSAEIAVPMMSKVEKLPYMSGKLFSAVKIPYGNGQYNMVVMLPKEDKNSQDIIDALSGSGWNNWMKSFKVTDDVRIVMPRFKYAFETKLKDVLKIMGMQKAFDDKAADFSDISDEFLYISDAVHKSYIDVNETGTEAAAVTGIIFGTTSVGNGPPVIPFIVDKPFVYAITEKDTGAILFIGEVNNPEYD